MERARGLFAYLALLALLCAAPAHAAEAGLIDLTRHPVGYLALVIYFVA